jgi:hypothetical protein
MSRLGICCNAASSAQLAGFEGNLELESVGVGMNGLPTVPMRWVEVSHTYSDGKLAFVSDIGGPLIQPKSKRGG